MFCDLPNAFALTSDFCAVVCLVFSSICEHSNLCAKYYATNFSHLTVFEQLPLELVNLAFYYVHVHIHNCA